MSYGPTVQCDDHKIAAIVEQHDSYIIDLARRYVPRSRIAREVLDLEIDELAQNTRIKLWSALCKKQIKNIKAYIRIIVRNEAINMLRENKYNTSPLVLDEDGELLQGKLVGAGEQMQDPADYLEHTEAVAECTSKATHSILALPPRQQHAMACALKDRIADILPLVEVLNRCGFNIEAASWSQDVKEKQRLRSSLVVARKKLQCTLT
jgi:RNA polymerase sigma factor (sigma-70 family)